MRTFIGVEIAECRNGGGTGSGCGVRPLGVARGFTLIELILALSIAAMLMLSLHTAVRLVFHGSRIAAAAIEPPQVATIAVDMVRRDLESIIPPGGVLSGRFYGIHTLNGQDDSDTLEFRCVAADTGDPSPLAEGIRRVELTINRDGDTPQLVRRVTRNLLAPVQEATPDEVVCRNIKSFSLRYFSGAEWRDEWDSEAAGNVLPYAVEVAIEIEPAAEGGTAYRATRIVWLSCATEAAETDTTGGAP